MAENPQVPGLNISEHGYLACTCTGRRFTAAISIKGDDDGIVTLVALECLDCNELIMLPVDVNQAIYLFRNNQHIISKRKEQAS